MGTLGCRCDHCGCSFTVTIPDDQNWLVHAKPEGLPPPYNFRQEGIQAQTGLCSSCREERASDQERIRRLREDSERNPRMPS